MQNSLRLTSVAAALTLTFAGVEALACEGMQAQAKAFKKINAEQLATLLAEKADLTVIDANSAETQSEFGVIPGAKLLSHYAQYDIAKELPDQKDSALVFYCGSKKCGAAPMAAKKALKAGYTDVTVMVDGVRGWVKQGKRVESPVQS